MRAVYIDGYKKPETIVYGERPTPEPGFGEVRVRIHAGGINRVDLYMWNGGAGITHKLPLILGVDGAGVIDKLGPEVRHRKVGERVVIYPVRYGLDEFVRRGDQMLALDCKIPGEHIDGCFADHICMPEACVFPIADGLDFVDAAVLPTAYLTAWRMVTTLGRVGSGDTVLIHGVGGGASTAALQFCKIANARVIVTSSDEAKLDKARKLGADETINYKREDVLKRVMALTDRRGVDVVIENVGRQTWDTSLKSVVRGGRIVVCGATTGGDAGADLQRVFIRQLQIFGSTLGNMDEFRTLISAAERKLFKPAIHAVFPMREAREALMTLDRGEQIGKLALRND